MYPYQNPDLSTEERISDLMSRMTLEEKILQTDQYYSGDFTTQDENGKGVQLASMKAPGIELGAFLLLRLFRFRFGYTGCLKRLSAV